MGGGGGLHLEKYLYKVKLPKLAAFFENWENVDVPNYFQVWRDIVASNWLKKLINTLLLDE